MSKLIGVVGWIGSGKDTVADYLVNNYKFERQSFAGSLKDAVAAVFGWDRELLEGATKEAREWREAVDTWWANRLNMPDLTPRLVLQLWGTEVCRNNFHEDIWVASVENKLRNTDKNIVISDCRFPNEVATIKRAGGKVIWVQRGEKPPWYHSARGAAKGNARDIEVITALNIHASEWAWLDSEFDHIIYNDRTLEDLYNEVDKINALIIGNRF